MSADRATAILARFTAAHSLFMGRLRELPPDVAEEQPDDRSWSPAQIACHVAMANEWTAGVLLGTTPLAAPVREGSREPFNTADVPPNSKFFPLDPPDIISRDNALERLRASGHHLSKAIASLTAERGSRFGVTLPAGALLLFELAEFAVTHVGRHSAQLGQAVEKSY
jgi:hypothetical protein